MKHTLTVGKNLATSKTELSPFLQETLRLIELGEAAAVAANRRLEDVHRVFCIDEKPPKVKIVFLPPSSDKDKINAYLAKVLSEFRPQAYIHVCEGWSAIGEAALECHRTGLSPSQLKRPMEGLSESLFVTVVENGLRAYLASATIEGDKLGEFRSLTDGVPPDKLEGFTLDCTRFVYPRWPSKGGVA